jgi:hypothetical protein
MAAFRNHAGSTVHAPHQSNLRRRAVAFLANGGNHLVLEQLRRLAWSIGRISTSERRIASDVNAVLLVPRDPVALLQVRVQFHLVDGGRMAGVVEESFELFW